MSESNSYAETVTQWEKELAAAERNSADLPQAEIPREKLQGVLIAIREVAATQSALTASKQEATQRIYTLLAQGRKVSTLLRTIVREHYGTRSEKLSEFGIQPF